MDIANRKEQEQIYLARVDKSLLCCLNGIEETSCNLSLNLNNTSELSFTLNKIIDGKISNGYDSVNEFMLLYITNVGWFKITSPPEVSFDGYKETKNITAESIEIELQNYDLVDFAVNTAQDNSLEMLIPDNVDELGIPKRNIKFYLKDDPDFSLLNILIKEYIPWWRIGHVDMTLYEKVMYFSVDNQNLYSFMTQDMAQAYECVFVFDYNNYTISAYDVSLLGEDTNVYIGFRNVENAISITTDSDNLYTTINVSGGDGLDNINYVNYETSTLENIDYYLNTNYLSKDTIAAYKSWKEAYENNRESFKECMKKCINLIDQASELKDRLPNDGCNTDFDSWPLEDLESAKSDYEAQIKGYEALYVDDNGQFSATLLAQSKGDFTDYNSIKQTILPNIDIAIHNLGVDDDKEKQDYLTNFETNWDLYGVDELYNKCKSYKNSMDVYSDFQGEYDEDSGYTKSYFDDKHKKYLEYKDNYNKCSQAYDQRKAEYDSVEDELATEEGNRTDIYNSVSKEKFLTKEQLISIRKLYKNTDYQNQNIIVTSIMDTDDILQAEEDLYQDAMNELSRLSQPQYYYNSTVENILALSEYESSVEKFKLGNFIRVEIEDCNFIKLRIISMQYNPLLYDNNFTITFSNMIQYKAKRNDFISLLNESMGASKNSISGTATSSKNFDASTISPQLLQKILNNGKLNDRLDSATIDAVKASTVVTKDLMSNYIQAGKLDVELANVRDLNADSAFMKFLDAEYAALDLANIKDGCIKTAMVGDGTIIDSKIVNLTASKLTAGTIDAANINVVNLAAQNITVGKINGQQIDDSTVGLNNLTEEVSTTITDASDKAVDALELAKQIQERADSGEFTSTQYNVEIHSSNGNMFKNGEITTTLSCHVYKDNVEITDQINASKFKWYKILSNGTHDEEWEAIHAGGVKEINVTSDDVYVRSTFECYVDLDVEKKDDQNTDTESTDNNENKDNNESN